MTQTSFRWPASAHGSFVMKTSPGLYSLTGVRITRFLTPSAIAPDWPGVAKLPCASSRPLRSVNMHV